MHELVPENGPFLLFFSALYFKETNRLTDIFKAEQVLVTLSSQKTTAKHRLWGSQRLLHVQKLSRERGGASVTTDCTAVPYALKRGYGPTSFSYSPGGDVPSRFARESVPSRPFLLEQRQHLSGKQ